MIVYVCKDCGYPLYKFEKVGQDYYGVRTPSEINSIYSGRCPACGHLLGSVSVDDIKITWRRTRK